MQSANRKLPRGPAVPQCPQPPSRSLRRLAAPNAAQKLATLLRGVTWKAILKGLHGSQSKAYPLRGFNALMQCRRLAGERILQQYAVFSYFGDLFFYVKISVIKKPS
jgi:hypothetical protein